MGQPLNNSSYFCNLLKISNKDSKNNSCVPKFVLILLIPLLEALLYIAVKIHCYNFKTGVRISLSPFFLFLLLVPMSSRCQKPCCPSDYPPSPHSSALLQMSIIKIQLRGVQKVEMCSQVSTITFQYLILDTSFICKGRKDRLCTVPVLEYKVTSNSCLLQNGHISSQRNTDLKRKYYSCLQSVSFLP